MTIIGRFERTRPLFQRITEVMMAKYENVLAEYVEVFSVQLRREITTSQWYVPFNSFRWPSPGGGYLVKAGPRNIVESGDLLNSFYVTSSEGKYGTSYSMGYSVDYLNAVRFGYQTARSKNSPATGPFKPRQMPGRDFVAAAIENLPFRDFLQSRASTNSVGKQIRLTGINVRGGIFRPATQAAVQAQFEGRIIPRIT